MKRLAAIVLMLAPVWVQASEWIQIDESLAIRKEFEVKGLNRYVWTLQPGKTPARGVQVLYEFDCSHPGSYRAKFYRELDAKAKVLSELKVDEPYSYPEGSYGEQIYNQVCSGYLKDLI